MGRVHACSHCLRNMTSVTMLHACKHHHAADAAPIDAPLPAVAATPPHMLMNALHGQSTMPTPPTWLTPSPNRGACCGLCRCRRCHRRPRRRGRCRCRRHGRHDGKYGLRKVYCVKSSGATTARRLGIPVLRPRPNEWTRRAHLRLGRMPAQLSRIAMFLVSGSPNT